MTRADTIIGLMWALNEADVVEEMIQKALPMVDTLYFVDDGSTDGTWEIVSKYKSDLGYLIQKPADADSAWSRNALLNHVRSKFKPNNSWVQIIESDIVLLTNPREAIERWAINNAAVYWQALNAVRREWTVEDDHWPNWHKPISEVLPYAHFMEKMLYTFRPHENLKYSRTRKPWPQGFLPYNLDAWPEKHRQHPDSPLLIHYGYRGPTHFWHKYRHFGKFHPKYGDWRVDSPEEILKTVAIFNGAWNRRAFEPTRENWAEWVNSRQRRP